MKISYFDLFEDLTNKLKKNKDNILFLTSSEEESLLLSSQLSFYLGNKADVYYYPSNDTMPYDRISPSQKIQAQRAFILTKLLSSNKINILVTKVSNIAFKMPPKDLFKDKYLNVKKNDTITASDIIEFLIDNSYMSTSLAVDSGEFSRRGDILDIVLHSGVAYRINFAWGKIETIKNYEPDTQISKEEVQEIDLYPVSELFLNQDNIETFRGNYLKNFGVQDTNNHFFENISLGNKVSGIESFSSVFYKEHSNIFEYLNSPIIYKMPLTDNSLEEFYTEFNDIYASRLNNNKVSDNFYPAFSPKMIISDKKEVLDSIKSSHILDYEHSSNTSAITDFYSNSIVKESKTATQQLLDFASENLSKKFIIFCSSKSSSERIKTLVTNNEGSYNDIVNISDAKKNIFNIAIIKLEYSFSNNNYSFISDKYLLGERVHPKKKSEKRLKNIFKELDNFSEGDLVVHVDHGIGRFERIENLEVHGNLHDCLLLTYNKGDKLFIPVENIHLIKRYGDNHVALDNLGSVSWQKRKAKLKDRIGTLALELINIAAKRKVIRSEPIIVDQDKYDLFCSKFPYTETEDQLRAIEEIQEDLKSDYPMDRLICGDVGFGKTEVAVRASYLVVANNLHKKQVAIIVPTTILARQHYNNFKERFKDFDIKIKQLSRLVSAKDIKSVKESLKNGEIDIIIGTHALLAQDIKFHELGMVIVDEEQHFGVVQKEKLKRLKNSVHNLTLSATPIPRTLQMSMIGIKELSLIATPPVDRLSVKTSVISFDEVIIRDALLREKFRGGKSFFVAPRISDLESLEEKLKLIAPELTFKTAHGRMAPSSIDKIMTDFYEGSFDVLLSTAIVESGLDIPSANTMIIFKAENMGLSQLYQLRGRVGRGKLRGYTYLVTNNKKMPTKSAVKRLEIMQSIESLGAGFSIASHDMDNRGFGNLVGDEQSGHIKEVGVELYQDMLEHEISRVQNKEIKTQKQPDINLKAEIYIPSDYISDQPTRLAIYRRAAEIDVVEEISEFQDELIDRFGKLPESVLNLLELMKIRIKCKIIGIKQLDMGANGFNIKFEEDANSEAILKFINNYHSNTKIKPENKIVFMKKIDLSKSVFETRDIVNKISEYFA